jgi:hypothetical protein
MIAALGGLVLEATVVQAYAPASIITALAGVVGVIGGLFVSKRGQADTRRQQAAADRMGTDLNKLNEVKLVVESLTTLNERLTAEAGRLASRAEAEQDRWQAEQDRWQEVERRCIAQAVVLTDAIATLKQVVTSEISVAAVDSTLAKVDLHPHNGTAPRLPKTKRKPGGSDDH